MKKSESAKYFGETSILIGLSITIYVGWRWFGFEAALLSIALVLIVIGYGAFQISDDAKKMEENEKRWKVDNDLGRKQKP